MKFTLIIFFLIYASYLFWRSSSNFFYQEGVNLQIKRNLLFDILKDANFSLEKISDILEAYGYFVQNPHQFDGATVVADFDTIRGLDASAMFHDWRYLNLRNKGFWYYLRGKIKADVEYGKNMRQLGITWANAWSRVVLLLLSTVVWMGYVFLTGKTKINRN